jgi:pimeloyl-ACP methyl ester carboxylesterase
MTKQQRRIVRQISAPIIAIIALVAALVASGSTATSAASPTPAAASTSPTPTPTPSPPPSTCGLSALCPITVNYYAPPDTRTPTDTTLCRQPYSPGDLCHVDLRGRLYLQGNRKLGFAAKGEPLVIFVHGSTINNAAPDASAMASFFVKQKIAFFALHRRGHGDSTGQNLDGVPDPDAPCVDGPSCDIAVIDNLCRQSPDVKQAIIKMKSLRNNFGQPIIDPTRIAILGHSLGGIVTLCANTHDLGQRTVIDIAAASENWDHYDAEDGTIDGHSPAIAALNNLVVDHVTPPMFLQPMNDCSTTPTNQFSIDVADQNELFAGTLFPNVTYNTTAPYGPPIPHSDCSTAHANFVFVPHWVDEWGPSVKAWLDRMFAPAASINVAPAP